MFLPVLFGAFTFLGTFPWLITRLINAIDVYCIQNYTKPTRRLSWPTRYVSGPTRQVSGSTISFWAFTFHGTFPEHVPMDLGPLRSFLCYRKPVRLVQLPIYINYFFVYIQVSDQNFLQFEQFIHSTSINIFAIIYIDMEYSKRLLVSKIFSLL